MDQLAGVLPEQQYLDTLRKIRAEGEWKPTRQDAGSVKTRGIPGSTFEFDLSQRHLPLISVRPLGGAVHYFVGEDFWIGSGSESLDDLHKFGVFYWDQWADAEHCGWKNLPVGHFGRTYGPQWRNFRGADGVVCDQLKRLFRLLRENPNDKRMRVHAWHPCESDNLVVRPCHGDFCLYQANGVLSMNVTQMSADVPIGIPSNFVMYSVLLYLFCEIFGYEPGTYRHNTFDTHYYDNQQAGVDIICDEREARPFPTVSIDPIVAEAFRVMVDDDLLDPLGTATFNPDGLTYNEWLRKYIKLEGYQPQGKIPQELLPVAI